MNVKVHGVTGAEQGSFGLLGHFAGLYRQRRRRKLSRNTTLDWQAVDPVTLVPASRHRDAVSGVECRFHGGRFFRR